MLNSNEITMDKFINSHAYAVIYFLKENTEITIPRFGTILFQKGYYVYSGSAKKNLICRVKRHIAKEKKLKWHIDYFSVNTGVSSENVFLFADKSECEINKYFKNSGGLIVVNNFGSSDCKNKCGSHFLYFRKKPTLKSIVEFGGIDGKLFILQDSK